MNKREYRFLSLTLASCSILLIGSGLFLSKPVKSIKKTEYSVNISQSRVNEAKTNIIELKDMKLEINTPLSVDVKDYLENVDELEDSIIKALKLDTSTVKTSEAGTYTYTVTFKRKKFNGTFTITEKKLPDMELTLKEISIPKGTALSTDVTTYVNEELTKEVKENIVLDISKVNAAQVGIYQYTITYNNKMYTSTINIFNKDIDKEENKKPENKDEEKEEDKDEEKKPEESKEPTKPSPKPSPSEKPTPSTTPENKDDKK